MLIILFSLLCFCLLVYIDFSTSSESIEERKEGVLYFNPEMVMINMNKDNENPFSTKKMIENAPVDRVLLNQNEYFYLQKSLFFVQFGEDILDQNINYLSFRTTCEDFGIGYSSSLITTFETKKDPFKKRIVRQVFINSQIGEIQWSETKYSGFLHPWKGKKISDMKITVDQAIQISRENSINCDNLMLENSHLVYITFGPYTSHSGWSINFGDHYEIEIDVIDGRIYSEGIPGN